MSLAIVYVATAADLDAASLTVAGRPVLFRAVAGAVRAGATRVLVPARFRALLAPALGSARRVARAVEWVTPATPPPGAALLVPATTLIGIAAVRGVLATPPPAVHDGSRAASAPVALAPAPLVASLWDMLASGTPVGGALDTALAGSPTTLVRDRSLVHAVRDAASAAAGERRLYTTLGSAIDSRWDTVFHRRFSRRVSRVAVAFGITPNTITLASLLVGLLAAWAFWRATPPQALAGLALYAMAVIIDHADGEVARLTLTESSIGEWLDIAVDTIIHVAIVLALGVTSAAVAGQGLAFGIAAALGVIASAIVAKAWPGLAMPDRVGAAIANLGSRDGFYAMLLAFIAARTFAPSLLPWLMIVVAGGTHAYWIGRVLYRLTRGA
jgi:phosphatidylglycerophosphate synthase